MDLEIFNKVKFFADNYEIDPYIVAGIIDVESSWNPLAIRVEPEWKYYLSIGRFAKINNITFETEKTLQRCSHGLMQIMGSVLREIGYQGNLTGMYDVELNLHYGCKKLKMFMDKYENETRKYLSAYNAGHYTQTNAYYVNKVINASKYIFEEINKNDGKELN